jgi:diguanylate cyclase (GGDEF) domain
MAEEYGKVPTDSKGMLIDGVACSSCIDSSGEIVDVEGVDCSQFEEDAGIMLNFEHNEGTGSSPTNEAEGAGSLVGKVVFLKKIFAQSDVDGERQQEYFDKCRRNPMIYIVGRLFDSSGHASAVALAATIRDNAKHHEPIAARFSIEGSTLDKKDNVIKSSIFRRLALTFKPANKTAVSGLLFDPQSDEKPYKIEKTETNPLFVPIGGSQTIECDPILDVSDAKLLKTLGRIGLLHGIAKAITAGSYDAAPGTLTGGAALQRECFIGSKKNQLLAKIRDTKKTFSKEELRAFVRAELPGVSEEFLNHFENVVDDFRLKKAQLAKKEPPYKLTPSEAKPKAVVKVPMGSEGHYKVKGRSGLFADGPKGEPNLVRGSIWNHKDQKSYLAPIKKGVKRAYFDEEKGVFHTAFGSFQAQKIPYVTDAKDEEAYKQLLNHPNLQRVMDVALPNWYKVHQLAGSRQLPEEIPMHSAMFSIMSANNRVPTNEMQLARMIDVMKKTGLDPRKPGFEAIAPFMKQADSPTELPTHSRAHFEGNPDMYVGGKTTGVEKDLFGNKVGKETSTGRYPGELQTTSPFMGTFLSRLSEYHKVHSKIMDVFKKHGNSMVDIAGALKDLVPGLGVKTALFTAGMSGGGSAPVPDTHHIRRTFGLHIGKDRETLEKIKGQMWDPENYQNTIRPYARWFAKNNPAVKHLLENPKFAHMFKGHEEDAAFPGFWLDWQAIQPWEKMKGLPNKSHTAKATHQPVWDAYAPYLKSVKEGDNLDPTLSMRTALVHKKYLDNYGEVPASFLYYSYIVPKLLEAADHRKKFESGLDFLAKSDYGRVSVNNSSVLKHPQIKPILDEWLSKKRSMGCVGATDWFCSKAKGLGFKPLRLKRWTKEGDVYSHVVATDGSNIVDISPYADRPNNGPVPALAPGVEHRFLAKSNEIEASLVELRKTIRETLEGAQVQMPEVYRVDIKHGNKTNPAGRYMVHDGQIRHLEDYHGILDSILPEGPVNADAIAKLHGMKLSDNFQVRQHEPLETEEPQEVRANLPQVEVNPAPAPKRAPVFEYYRPGLDKPHVVEFGAEGAALDGQKLEERELALMLENANSGLAKIKWKKSEPEFYPLEKMAITAIKPGKALADKKYDYSHLLKDKTSGLKLAVVEHGSFNNSENQMAGHPWGWNDNLKESGLLVSALLLHPNSSLQRSKAVGRVIGEVTDKGLKIHLSDLKPGYMGKGYGKTMYEALMAHAYHKMGAKKVYGTDHSTLSHRVHESLAQKHGTSYSAVGKPNGAGYGSPGGSWGTPKQGPGAYDAKYGSYSYHIKSEDEDSFESLLKAENLMPPTEALKHIRELVGKGLVHPDIERSLTNHIYVDPMTGLGNKLAYREFRDQKKPGVWASLDLNSFKHINDKYGHDTGDEAIQAVGGALKEAGAKVGTGKLMRPGGDEFAGWFPSYEEASRFIRHAKKNVDALPPVGGVHKHSFSFGLGNDFGTADKALLEAKKQKLDPVTKQSRFPVENTPHLGHSLVPGTEGPLLLESEGPPQRTLPAQMGLPLVRSEQL